MKLFSNTCAKRNTAFVVLLVWLFALASGVANACLLEARQTHSPISTAASFEAAQERAIESGHMSTVASHNDGSDSFKAPCLKVCDDGSRSLPKLGATVAQIDLGAAPLVAVLWSAVEPSVATGLQKTDDLRPTTARPPIRVRYSRLAL
jgi:hypothetical protein